MAWGSEKATRKWSLWGGSGWKAFSAFRVPAEKVRGLGIASIAVRRHPESDKRDGSSTYATWGVAAAAFWVKPSCLAGEGV